VCVCVFVAMYILRADRNHKTDSNVSKYSIILVGPVKLNSQLKFVKCLYVLLSEITFCLISRKTSHFPACNERGTVVQWRHVDPLQSVCVLQCKRCVCVRVCVCVLVYVCMCVLSVCCLCVVGVCVCSPV